MGVQDEMEKVNYVTGDLKKEILDFLYFDEIYNAILIEQIQDKTDEYDGLYINKDDGKITDILHIRNDGNSDLTNFSYSSEKGLENIAYEIKSSNLNKILLAGKLEAVSNLLKVLNKEKFITPNTFYKLDVDKYRNVNMKLQSKIRPATPSDCDLKIVKQFTVKFFEAETAEDIAQVTNNKKILDKIKTGVYILELDNNVIGMARFIGKTSNFAEITSVFIDEKYRGNGFGKELIFYMIEIAINEGRTPILATSISNIAAIKTYENMGFVKYGDCAFEFLE
jgi:ribosomal protein S18 acetylase RimI-like enzyme